MNRELPLPERIGLCLSGGGFRAAAFHLGTLSYLQRVGLLDRVCRLSTVSGGTFTGAKYALSRLEGTPPETFFLRYHEELRTSRIFPKALEILGNGQPLSNDSGRKNIITCAAQSYCETFFRRPADGQPILFGELLDGETSPLTEITFNATDFRTGLAFRFQKSATGRIGNHEFRIPRSEAAQIRLGDIVAASSCFPGGFEPLEFPRDFSWSPGIPEGIAGQPATPLMDGGVYDNQGLESLLLRTDNSDDEERGKDLDLIVISDTDRQEDGLYSMPPSVADMLRQTDPRPNFVWRWLAAWNPSLGTLAWLSWWLMACCGASALAVGINLWLQLTAADRPALGWMLLTNLVPLFLSGGAALLLAVFRSMFRNKLLSRIPQLSSDGWSFLQHVKLNNALDMVVLRVSSLLALTSGVFMKRIRSAGFRSVYNDPRFQGKIAANFIYSIRPGMSWTFAAPKADRKMPPNTSEALLAELATISAPSRTVCQLTASAAAVPTLLWFESDEQLRCLVAAGQITTCLSLLKFVARTREFDETSRRFADAGVQQLWENLRADWTSFQAAPDRLADFSKP